MTTTTSRAVCPNRISMKKYVVGVGSFPKRWRDKIGKITVMGEPIKGYVMVRRPGAMPFVLSVAEILNTDEHPTVGPFECLDDSPQRKEQT
jgi:hypothetical protein